jgi:thymidylate synthase (FAD)
MIEVLNYGYVRLVESMGTDLSIVRSARVSYNCAPRNDGSDDKLIKYLLVNNHTSPFESVVFTFEVRAPIFVLRQWHRHRTWSFNEVSARYTELPDEMYIPDADKIGYQSTSSKQAREIENKRSPEEAEFIRQHIEAVRLHSFNTYRVLLDTYNVPRELARTVLPVSTYSSMFASVDLHNLLHFLKLRLHEHAQHEIRVYAEALLKLIEPIVPITIKYWREINSI